MEEQLDEVKDAIVQQSNQVQKDNQWVSTVRDIISHYQKKIGVVEQDANHARENINRLFEKKREFENTLLKLRLDEEKSALSRTRGHSGEVYSSIASSCAGPVGPSSGVQSSSSSVSSSSSSSLFSFASSCSKTV